MGSETATETESIVGILHDIKHGHRGWYGVSATNEYGSVTFSLNLNVWKGAIQCTKEHLGAKIVLSHLIEKPAGWRALEARFYTVKDERITD